jgi:hypothetical protein
MAAFEDETTGGTDGVSGWKLEMADNSLSWQVSAVRHSAEHKMNAKRKQVKHTARHDEPLTRTYDPNRKKCPRMRDPR